MRSDIPKKRNQILQWVDEKKPKSYMCRQLKCRPITLNTWLVKMGIEYKGNQGSWGVSNNTQRKPAKEFLKYGTLIPSHRLKLKLLEDGIKEHKCEVCGCIQWNGKLIPIELHHIDGDRFNNNLYNLQIICPNCHAQMPNSCRKKNAT